MNKNFFYIFGFCLITFLKVGVVSAKGNVEISAEDGLEWDSNKKIIFAKKNASILHDGMKVVADKIQGNYRETEGKKTDIYKIMASGNVVGSMPGYEMNADVLDYDFKKEVIYLKNNNESDNVVKLISENGTIEAYKGITFYKNKNYAVAKKAEIINGDRVFSGDTLNVYLTKGKNGKFLLKEVKALGNIVIKDNDQFIYGDNADFNNLTNVAKIYGNVSFEKTNSAVLSGGNVIYNMKTGKAKFVPVKKGGKVIGVFSSSGKI